MSDTPPQGQPDEAMVDLLVKQVTEGLSPDEQRALDVMDSALASAFQRDLQRAAAAVTLAGSAGQPQLPAALAERLARQAADHFATPSTVTDLGAARTAVAAEAVRVPARLSRPAAYGGWLAAAACLVLALFAWQRTPPAAPVVVVTRPAPKPPIKKPAPTPTPTEERAALLAKSDSLKITLGATKDPAAVGTTGDVVWDPVSQRGFLHFAGLAANDPAVHQYQIWIFDAARDKRYPVAGGVFDVPANATEVVIPIRAELMVLKPAAFAVSIEKSGGVVVSGREHIIALGAANPS